MLDSVLNTTSLLTDAAGALSATGFLICIASALVLGLVLTLVYKSYAQPTKSFAITLATLPAIVAVIIIMVNGNLGAGVAVAGAFSLVRFRSAAGTAKEIGAIFTAMAIGLACGMGYPLFAALFTVILCAVYLVYAKTNFGASKKAELRKTLRITVPEDLEYAGMFDDLFEQYTTEHKLSRIKTTNLGSMNALTYDITLKEAGTEKALIDQLRVRNGNLEISLQQLLSEASDL